MAPPAKGHGGAASAHRKPPAGKVVSTTTTTVILDNGADRLKVGLAGDPEPRFRVPNCTAKLKGQLHVRTYWAAWMCVGGGCPCPT